MLGDKPLFDAASIIPPDTMQSIKATLADGLKVLEPDFRQQGRDIGNSYKAGIKEVMMNAAAEVFEAIAAGIEAA